MRTWLNGQTSPEMLYLETKWASLIPFARATDLLKEVLPVGDLMNAETVRNHLQCARCRADPDCLPPRPARVRVGEPALGSGRPAPRAAANDRISNGIAGLPIFPHYSFELDALYGAVDGQKFGVERPTVKARHSRKYFGRGKGVVAYTLLCNHVPLQGWLIGAHEYEAHHVFDIWYRNTSDIMPAAITGDMHSVNKANFAILHWFGLRFEPRFTDLDEQLKELYCADDPAQYAKCLIRPVGQIDRQAIVDEKVNIDQIVATLGLKEMTQGTLIRKLCTFTTSNPTRRAIFEFDKLIRSIYTLRYLRDPQLQRNVHRSQNRIESYHQLRSAIAQVGGKKELTGRTDIEIEISNQCARLIANAIIYSNSAILSRLLTKYEASGNAKALVLIKKMSPAAWRHIHLNGHYTFRGDGQLIDLAAIVAGAGVGVTEFSGVWAYNPNSVVWGKNGRSA